MINTDVVLHVRLVMLGLIAGAVIGFMFDVYRVLRGIINPGKLSTALGDLLFWIFGTVAIGLLLFSRRWVEMRFYIAICIGAGILIYMRLFSRLVVTVMVFLLRMTSRIVNGVMRSAFLPLRWVFFTVMVTYYRIRKLINRLKTLPKILRRI